MENRVLDVSAVKVHLSAGSYQFVEFEIPALKTTEDVLSFVEACKQRELKMIFSCEHEFYDTKTSKKGMDYCECWKCGQLRFKSFDGSWSPWQRPINRKDV